MFDRVDLFTLLVDDVDAAVAFYVGALGLTIRSRRGDHVELTTAEGATRIAIFSRLAFARVLGEAAGARIYKGSSATLAFRCETEEEVDDVYRVLVSRGARCVTPPETMPWGQRATFFADPDGNIVEVFAEGTLPAEELTEEPEF